MDLGASPERQQIDPHRELAVELLNQAYSTDGLPDQVLSQVYHENICLIENRLEEHFGREAIKEKLSQTEMRKRYIRQLVRVALLLSQMTVPGYYALQFNRELRAPLDQLTSLKLPQTQFDPCPLEEEALYQAFLEGLSLSSPKFFRNHGEAPLWDDQVDDLYSRHYNRLSLREDSGVRSRTKSCPQNVALFKEGPYTFCLETRELLRALQTDRVNPITGVKFSPETLAKLFSEYQESLSLLSTGA